MPIERLWGNRGSWPRLLVHRLHGTRILLALLRVDRATQVRVRSPPRGLDVLNAACFARGRGS